MNSMHKYVVVIYVREMVYFRFVKMQSILLQPE